MEEFSHVTKTNFQPKCPVLLYVCACVDWNFFLDIIYFRRMLWLYNILVAIFACINSGTLRMLRLLCLLISSPVTRWKFGRDLAIVCQKPLLLLNLPQKLRKKKRRKKLLKGDQSICHIRSRVCHESSQCGDRWKSTKKVKFFCLPASVGRRFREPDISVALSGSDSGKWAS